MWAVLPSPIVVLPVYALPTFLLVFSYLVSMYMMTLIRVISPGALLGHASF